MTRQEFIKICGLLGMSISFQPSIASQKHNSISNFDGKVLIIGAGAAGLTAGYQLAQKGIDFEIIEASTVHGGRMKQTKEFVDFPIPLGAEWLHVRRGIFDEIVNNQKVKITTKTKPYNKNVDSALYEGYEISLRGIGFKIEQKFINSSWLDFFDEYITPAVVGKINLDEIVTSIDYGQEKVEVKTKNSKFTADKVIFTAPVKMLQKETITFTPVLPSYKLKAVQNVTVWDGFKAFIEFTEKFYPEAVGFKIKPRSAGQKLYYDVAYGQDSKRNVLGLFSVGTGTLPYRKLSHQELKVYMLKELDELFDGKASPNYINHISQNWNEEPFINGAYINDRESPSRIRALGKSIDKKIFFAGTCYTMGEDWGSVHTAARSAIRAVNELLS